MSDIDLIDHIVDGLGSEYKEFITSLNTRPTTTLDDLTDLLEQEETLQKKFSSVSLTSNLALTAGKIPPRQAATNSPPTPPQPSQTHNPSSHHHHHHHHFNLQIIHRYPISEEAFTYLRPVPSRQLQSPINNLFRRSIHLLTPSSFSPTSVTDKQFIQVFDL